MSPSDSQLSDALRRRLHAIARASLEQGVRTGQPFAVELSAEAEVLCEPRGCFVTLRKGERLRGCLGSLEAAGPLASEVARLAYAAARDDPRFNPVESDELAGIDLKLSVLGVPELVAVSSEQELLDTLRPGLDGVILSEGHRRSTFLPEVWGSMKSGREFLEQLRLKASLPANYWSDTLRIERYTTESF